MRIDLNADLGESEDRWTEGSDRSLLQIVTSANVCCGAYAGGADLITDTCRLAEQHGVAIGAQVGYPDREHFGRVPMDMSFDALQVEVYSQIETLRKLAAEVGAQVRYVKPHGALYHAITRDENQAAAVVDAVASAGSLPLVGPPGSLALDIARSVHMPIVVEGFADRGYAADGTLLARTEPGALLDDPDAVARQTTQLARIGVRTVCVHSDTPQALDIARAARRALEREGAEIRAFAP